MKTTLHRITTSDGIELVGLLYEPDGTTQKVLVHVHGMAGNFYENKFLDSIAETLASNGVAFFAFNNRGCELMKDLVKVVDGKRKIVRIGNAYELFDDSVIDIACAIDFAVSRGFSEIHLSGHSLGSPKVAHYVANAGDARISSLILISPSDMVGLAAFEPNHEKALATARDMIAHGRGGELIPFPVLWDGSPVSAQAYIGLASKESNVAIFNFHDTEDSLPVLGKIALPTIAIMGRKDDALVISIEDTMRRIKSSLTNAPKAETIILGDADHGFNGLEQQLADAIYDWIREF